MTCSFRPSIFVGILCKLRGKPLNTLYITLFLIFKLNTIDLIANKSHQSSPDFARMHFIFWDAQIFGFLMCFLEAIVLLLTVFITWRNGSLPLKNSYWSLNPMLNPTCKRFLPKLLNFMRNLRAPLDHILSNYRKWHVLIFRYFSSCSSIRIFVLFVYFLFFFVSFFFLQDFLFCYYFSILVYDSKNWWIIWYQEAKEFSKPYIDQVVIVTKPFVEKLLLVPMPYKKHVARAYRKSLRTARTFHRQVFHLFGIFLTYVAAL